MKIQIIQPLGANIRKQPTTKSPIIGTAPYNQVYDYSKLTPGEQVGNSNQWYELTVGGYIHSSTAKEYVSWQLTPYSQNDLRWKFQLLGFGSYLLYQTIGYYGCAVTACAILCGIDPSDLNNRLKNSGGFIQATLLVWTALKQATGGKLTYISGVGIPFTEKKHQEILAREGACILEVEGGGIPKPNKHFVVSIGNGLIMDPIDGKTRQLSTYKVLQLRDIHITK